MPMLAHFIEAHDLTDEEVAELEGCCGGDGKRGRADGGREAGDECGMGSAC